MPDIPVGSSLEYIGVFFLIFGLFLILAGFNIINIQQITVTSGKKTYILGIIFTLVGLVFVFLENSTFSSISPENTASPPRFVEENATVETPQQPIYLYHDDFSDENSGWNISSDSISERFYRDGKYIMRIEPNNSNSNSTEFSINYGGCYSSWSTAGLGKLTDVAIDVDAEYVSGAPNGLYGIIFYYQDTLNFYYYEIFSSDGQWDLVQRSPTGFFDQVSWQRTPAIRIGKSPNHLHIEISNTVSLIINEQLISTIQIPSQSGDVGLWTAICSEDAFEVAFDNFSVTQLSK